MNCDVQEFAVIYSCFTVSLLYIYFSYVLTESTVLYLLEEYCFLSDDILQSGRNQLVFWRNHCHHLLKIRVVGFSEFSTNAYQATWSHVPKNCTLHSHLHENLKSHFLFMGLCKFNRVLLYDKMLEYLINTNIHIWSGLKTPFIIINSKLNKVKL